MDWLQLSQIVDLWTSLACCGKPIVLYGMGDGADKIMQVADQRNLPIAGVFASDEFVRKKIYRGFPLRSYDQIKEQFDSFVVLVAFGSHRPDVLQHILRLAHENKLYAPDLPVYGDGLFDKAALQNHLDEVRQLGSVWGDATSRWVFQHMIAYKLTGKLEELFQCATPRDEAMTTLVRPRRGWHFVDIGAYDGDTLQEFAAYVEGDGSITAFEPDQKSFMKLEAAMHEMPWKECRLIPVAAWNCRKALEFHAHSGRNSSHAAVHDRGKKVLVQADAADHYLEDQRVDYIKIDAEGAEREALEGLNHTILRCRPVLNVAVYHRVLDLLTIPQSILRSYPFYRLYLRHFPCIPGWDTNLYAVPDPSRC